MFYITQQVIYQCGVEPLARDTPTSTPPEQGDATKHGNSKSEILEEHSRMDVSEGKGTGTLRERGTSMKQLVRTHQSVSSDQLLHGGATLSQRPGTLPFRNVHPAVLF